MTIAQMLAAASAALMTTAALAGVEENKNTFFEDWGVGLAVIKPQRKGVADAAIVNNIVRANTVASHEATLLVARHFYPFRPKDKKCSVTDSTARSEFWTDCVGAMVAVGVSGGGSSGNSQVINFAGVGLTIGGGIANSQSTSWHFGAGYGRRFNVKVLGDGFSENAAPPAGETQVRYKTVDVAAPFVYFTAHW